MHALLVLVAVAAATAQAAGMYDKPYALVEPGFASDVRKEARVAVTRIDGASTRSTRDSDPIPPGKHTITLRFETEKGRFRPESRDIQLDLDPCTRYRVVAAYEVKTGPDWKPKVYAEPIGECTKKFGTPTAK